MRRPIIAGNWKMNKTPSQAKKLVEEIKALDLDPEVDALVCVPAIDLGVVAEELKDSVILYGAQNMYSEDSGAYTGEISAKMLTDIGASYVIVGHSERREIFGETDEDIAAKVDQALAHNIKPILCVGESLEEREAGQAQDKVKQQLSANLANVKEEDLSHLVVAYEPIWAIGTGKTASAEDAGQMATFIRQQLAELYSPEAADGVRIQYGGSVKPENVKEIMAQEDIDGALVGGASLQADSFGELVNFNK